MTEEEEYERQRYEEHCYYQALEAQEESERQQRCETGQHEWNGDVCGWCGFPKPTEETR